MPLNATWNPNMDLGFSTINTIFDGTTFFGTTWLLPLIILALSMLLITRDVNEWKTLALPMTIMWLLVGIDMNVLIIITATIFFAVDILSLKLLGSVLDIAKEATTGLNFKEKNLERKVEQARKETKREEALFKKAHLKDEQTEKIEKRAFGKETRKHQRERYRATTRKEESNTFDRIMNAAKPIKTTGQRSATDIETWKRKNIFEIKNKDKKNNPLKNFDRKQRNYKR